MDEEKIMGMDQELNSGREILGRIADNRIKRFFKKFFECITLTKQEHQLPSFDVKNFAAFTKAKHDFLPVLSFLLCMQYFLELSKKERFYSLCLFMPVLGVPLGSCPLFRVTFVFHT